VVHRRTLKANFTAPSAEAPNAKLSVGTRNAFHEYTNANSWKQRQDCKCTFKKEARDSIATNPDSLSCNRKAGQDSRSGPDQKSV